MKIALAPRDFERPLLEELGQDFQEQHGRLLFYSKASDPVWAQNIWFEPKRFTFSSISEAAKELRAHQRNWWLHSTASHRRAKLITEQLPPLKIKPRPFPSSLPTAPLGSWTLLDDKTLLYSARCSSPFPDGEVEFVENKTGPPSRAYLKLWETFTITGKHPAAGARVLDLGSSPGGWTWVLDQMGCEVLSVDKAALEFSPSPRVQWIKQSAFSLEPESVGKVDWLFSDVICYPKRLLALIERWREAGAAKNFVCTLKFQGPTDHDIIREFQKIPGGRLQHLSCNRHELTWTLLDGG